MNLIESIKVIILGIIQGITEWLPVSSTGHMLLFDQIMPLKLSSSFISVFMVVVQLGSIMAVVVLYFGELWPLKKDRSETVRTLHLWLKVMIATIPAGIAGLLLDNVIDEKLSSWPVIAAALFIYGVLYLFLEKKTGAKVRVRSIDELTIKDSIFMGLFQMLALIPGTSRSGSTILGGLIGGISRPVAAKFSFFMAIPVMAGASLLRLVKSGFSFSVAEWGYLALGSAVAFIVSLAAIKGLMSYVREHDFSIFGVYRIILSVIVVIYFTVF